MRFLKFITVLFGASASVAAPFDQPTQKLHLETLLASARPFAATMLQTHGEFIPYGEIMAPDFKITAVGGDTGDEHPKSMDVIALLKDGYRRDGASGKILASAVVYDVRIVPPGQTEKTDAVAIDLNHRDGMSVIMYYPYRITKEKEVVFGALFASKGSNDIFKHNH